MYCAETYLAQMVFSFVLGAVTVGMIAIASWPQKIEEDEHRGASVG